MLRKTYWVIPLLLWLASCTLNEPQIPSWDTQWTVFLPVKNVAMTDIIKGDSLLYPDTTANGIPIYNFSINDSSDWQRIEAKDLSIGEQNDSYRKEIGEVQLDEGTNLSTDQIKVSDILPSGFVAHGDTIPAYPGFSAEPSDPTVSYDYYDHVSVDSGYLTLTFHNQMFFTIDAGMQISIFNDANNELIGSFLFQNQILPFSTAQSRRMDLAGKTISNRLRVHYNLPIAGSDTTKIVESNWQDEYFYSDVSLSDLKVSEALAKVPEQSITHKDSIAISMEGNQVRRATIRKGGLHFNINNQLPVNAHIRLELPDIQHNGEAKIVTGYIPGGQAEQLDVDLTGWELVNHQNPGEFLDTLFYNLSATTDSTEGFVSISSGDFVAVDVHFDSLYFQSLTGKIAPVEVDIPATEVNNLDFFKDFEGGIRLDDLVMTLTVQNQVDFPVDLDLKIAGYHQADDQSQPRDSVVIHLQREVQPSSVSPQTQIILDANSTTPSIVDLIEILPTQLIVTGTATVQGEGSVQLGEGVRVLYSVESPLSLELKNPIIRESGIDTLTKDDIDSSAQQRITEDIREAYVEFIIKNGLPLGTQIKFYMATDSTRLYDEQIADSSTKWILEAAANAGTVGSDGYVHTPQETRTRINLSHDKLQIFNHLPLYTRQVVTILPTNGTVRVRQSDKIKVDAVVHVKYRVDLDQ